MRKLMIIFVTLLLIVSASTVTYAWLTYVQKKSVATIQTHQIELVVSANDTVIDENIAFDNLAFIDYQNDLIQDVTGSFDLMASVIDIKIEAASDSPASRSIVTFSQAEPGLIYVIVLRAALGTTIERAVSFYQLIQTMIIGSQTKEEQLANIADYNQSVLDQIEAMVLMPGDSIELQIAAWGDYETLMDPLTYQLSTFMIQMSIHSVNSKGEVIS